MYQDTFRFLIFAALFAFCLVGAAAVLTGCESAGRIAAYCLKNPEKCD
jgi:hypothetical protein